jgi:hypothetical protein
MLLYSSFKKRSVGAEDRSGILFYTILDQINRGVPALLQDEEQRASIAKMNHDVATQMMQAYNYTAIRRTSCFFTSRRLLESELRYEYKSLLSSIQSSIFQQENRQCYGE